MIDNDLKEFGLLLTSVGEIYGKRLNETTIKIYWRAWQQYEFCHVRQALCDYVINPDIGQQFPKPADIIRLLHGDSEIRALQAWGKVASAIRSFGGYNSIAFDDALTHAVIGDMGGWQRLCVGQESQLPFVAKEFEKRYQSYVHKPPLSYPKYFIGVIENQNTHEEKNHESLVLIGEHSKVMQVIASGANNAAMLGHRVSLETIKLLSPEPNRNK